MSSNVKHRGKTKKKIKKIQLQRRREKRHLKVAHKKKIGKGGQHTSHVFVKTQRAKFYHSKILEFLRSKNFTKTQIKRTQKIYMRIPNIFCFSRNPDESTAFLRELASNCCNKYVREIHFDHTKCACLGACASTIMDIILMESKQQRESQGFPIVFSGDLEEGKVSNNDEIDTFLKVSGLLNHLNLVQGTDPNVEKLELLVNGDSSDVAEDVIDYLNRALGRHSLSLTKPAMNNFGQMLGEIVDNCKLHAGDNATWFTLGHYGLDKKSGYGKCKLVIFDFGNTIYESLKYNSTALMNKKIKHYIRKGRSRFKPIFNEEVLYTLFSLQQRVSRVFQKDTVRGNGTITFIDAFQTLFQTEDPSVKSLLSITSGSCNILFDGTYLLKEESFGPNTNKIIAFNDSNRLDIEPDKNYVRSIKNSFPGTLISMELYIDKKYLTKKG